MSIKDTIAVCEIFASIQGESTRAGWPCVFIRLSGCNLRCNWCDTTYAWEAGDQMTIEDILAQTAEFGIPRVEVTGGEPLAQTNTAELLTQLCAAGYEVLLETNGSVDISTVDPKVVRIVDIKCPSSGVLDKNLTANYELLTANDEVKFVVADRDDFDFACATLTEHNLIGRCVVTFSPVEGRLGLEKLAEWILADGLDVRLGFQLHKIIWPDKDRGV